ncbi:DUF3761 domain-containing protein (plasmid) [Paraburkholderia sp. PREW-6R]|uniref:DUF3761 domain-containing protein n=1 Tax=Paraburkholderia sp. PREW-6R TaxID=3141544 RepID=UPI0031F4B7B9
MKHLLFAALIGIVVTPAFAYRSEPDESQLREHHQYTNRSGQHVHSPAHSRTGGVPTGATAHCGDGTYSFSQHHSGTCSHHGGVAEWE